MLANHCGIAFTGHIISFNLVFFTYFANLGSVESTLLTVRTEDIRSLVRIGFAALEICEDLQAIVTSLVFGSLCRFCRKEDDYERIDPPMGTPYELLIYIITVAAGSTSKVVLHRLPALGNTSGTPYTLLSHPCLHGTPTYSTKNRSTTTSFIQSPPSKSFRISSSLV